MVGTRVLNGRAVTNSTAQTMQSAQCRCDIVAFRPVGAVCHGMCGIGASNESDHGGKAYWPTQIAEPRLISLRPCQ